MKLRPIAFYLPQFHPVPENDEWWGKGFTEWTNVTRAKPFFRGHHQPHLPADLGFYDLRLPETRQQQADLARKYGIYGFCYYHYWFNGRRILERPLLEVFESGQPDFPFMLCWANENWTRVWDGGDKKILLKQEYSLEDDRLHIRSLIPYFKDPRYIRIDGKAVFCIYKSTILPSPAETLKVWREETAKEGIELYICRMENFGTNGPSYMKDGFDASIEFQPFAETLNDYREQIIKPGLKKDILKRIVLKANRLSGNKEKESLLTHRLFSNIDYNEFVDFLVKTYRYAEGYTRFPGITPSWDNSARVGKWAFLMKNANPLKYKEWLEFHYQHFRPRSKDENLLFINAWNEWAEGNHLEPCRKWGNQYLEATGEVVNNNP